MMTRSRKADLLLAQDLESAAAPEAEGDMSTTSTQAVRGPETSGVDEARCMAASTDDTADSFRSTQGGSDDPEDELPGTSTGSEMSIDDATDLPNQLQGHGPHQDDSGASSSPVHAAAPSDGYGGSTPSTSPAVTTGAGDTQSTRSEASEGTRTYLRPPRGRRTAGGMWLTASRRRLTAAALTPARAPAHAVRWHRF